MINTRQIGDLVTRQLVYEDHSNYLHLLGQLTDVGDYNDTLWKCVFNKIQQQKDFLHVYVITPHDDPNTLLAAGTLLMEQKFIHGGALVGHLEDIVVNSDFRKMGLGSHIINFLVDKANELGAYKVILDCKVDVSPFYERCGFQKYEIQMRKNL